MDTTRFTRIRTLKDIRLEKAKLRYEMLVAENKLNNSIAQIQGFFTVAGLFSNIRLGFRIAHVIYNNVRKIIDKLMFWRKDKTG